MIASISGILVAKSPTEITVNVNGIGYSILIPLSTFQKLGEVNTQITLCTHLHVRDDALQLFGFATPEERELFRLLISISGIGPRIAQAILSGMSTEELRQHIASGETAPLMSIPNVGRKTAERIVLELRDKLAKGVESVQMAIASPTPAAVRNETLLALTSLGYARLSAEKAIRTALRESGAASLSVEELIKLALRHVSDR